MPVPFPSAQDVNLERPDAAEAQSMTDAVASVVSGHDGLLPLQQRLLVAIFSAMTEHAVTLEGRPRLTVPEATASFARRDLQFRSRMVQTMLLCALVRRPIPEDVVLDIATAAAELGVRDGMVDVAQEFAAGSLGLAAVDFSRNGYEGGWNAEEAAAAVHASHPLGSAWAFCEDDEEMAAQWRSLEHLAADTLGRKVWEMYQARGFAFPGTPGSAPPMLTQHDWVHVLADYGTTVESEVEVFGLHRPGQRRPACLLAPGHGHLALRDGIPRDGRRALRAFRGPLLVQPAHGGAPGRCHVPGRCVPRHRGWSGQRRLPQDGLVRRRPPQLRRPAGQVQSGAEVGGGAREAGAVGPWEPGGISPFQLAAGQALAAARGVPYDAHGASA